MPTRIDMRVQPKTSRRDVQREVDGWLRVRVTSAAEAGKANEDVLAAIAKARICPSAACASSAAIAPDPRSSRSIWTP